MKDAVLQLAGPAYTSQEQPDAYVRRLEAACQLLHEGVRPPQAMGAQTASSCPAAHSAPPANPPTPSATGSNAAGELCTLLLTDQEVLDVVLALHDIRAAQLCHLMPRSGSQPLKLPPPSEALAQQLSKSQRSVPGSQLLSFVSALDSGNSLKELDQGKQADGGCDAEHTLQAKLSICNAQELDQVCGMENTLQVDPLLRVWDSMLRAMQLVLAALQSLPIRPHPQDPDPAATTPTSTTPQLPPGYMRCSACLLLSLRLAICLAQHCLYQPLEKVLALAWLHGTLPGLLLGLSTSVTVMQAAGHPEAQAQRVQFVRCLLHLGTDAFASPIWRTPQASSDSSGRSHGSSRGQASSRGRHGDTARSGASQSAGDKLHALAVISYGHLAQALCDVLGRQEEAFALKELITTCQQEGAGLGSIEELCKNLTNFGMTTLTVTSHHSIDLQQPLKDAARASSRTKARIAASRHSAAVVSTPPLVSDILTLLARCLPGLQAAVLAVKLSATLGTVEHMGRTPHAASPPSLLPATVQRLPEMEEKISNLFIHATHLWSLVLAQDGVNEPPTGPFRLDGNFLYRLTIDRVAVLPSPSSPQLAPLALDLVLGMENTLQMVMQQQDMVWQWPFWNDGNLVQGLADGYRTLLDLFGHAIEVLATPGVVGPAGLAAQPASWLPCGNSLVEGWCTRLLAGVCKLMCITTPASAAVPVPLKIMLNRRLRGSYRLLLRGQRQAPPSMSPEAERLLSCLTLVLTAMLPQELCLALARGGTNTVPGLDLTFEKEKRAMGVALSKLQPEQVWTWQALAAGTPAEATLQGLLSALASLYQVQGLVTPIAPGWRHQPLTLALGEWQES